MVVSFVKCAPFWVCTFVSCAHLLGVHIYIFVGVNEKMPSHFKQICYTPLLESNVIEKTFATVEYLMKPVSNMYNDPNPCVADDFHCKQGVVKAGPQYYYHSWFQLIEDVTEGRDHCIILRQILLRSAYLLCGAW